MPEAEVGLRRELYGPDPRLAVVTCQDILKPEPWPGVMTAPFHRASGR